MPEFGENFHSRPGESLSERPTSSDQSVVLAGLPFGLSPTYWVPGSTGINAAARASALVAPDAQPNAERLSALISFTSPARTDDSLFDGVWRVPSDSTVEVNPDGRAAVIERQRNIDSLEMTELEAATKIWELVLASVSRSIAGAKRVAVLTGGGVDSGALLAAAVDVCRRTSGAEVHAITLHFGGEGDDRPHMRELERSLGIQVHRVTPLDAAPAMRPLLDNTSLPLWSPSAAGDISVLRRAREVGADVVLTGTGGDDLFDGYPDLLADAFAAGDLRSVAMARRLRVPWSSTSFGRITDFIVRPLVGRTMPHSLQSARRRRIHRARWPWAGPNLLTFMDSESRRWRRSRIRTPSGRFDSLAKATHMADLVEYFDELSSLASVRLAHPYLDENLLSLISGLPQTMLFQGGRLRGLFRLAARGALPEKIRLREDKARFNLARQEMLRAAGGVASFEDLATMRECEKLGLIEPKRFRVSFDEFARDQAIDDTLWTWLWPALAIEGFLRARATRAR